MKGVVLRYLGNLLQMKRITVTLPDISYDELEDWADQQGRPVANLATYLIEQSITEAKRSGDYTPRRKPAAVETFEVSTVQQLIFQGLASPNRRWSKSNNPIQVFVDEVQLEINEVQSILAGNRPSTEQCLAIARVLDMDEVQLLALVKHQYNGESKSQARV